VREDTGAVEYEIPPGRISIGRAKAHNLVLDRPEVSTNHAEMQRTADALSVCDAGSTNGTFVNGAPVGPEFQPLRDGDRLSLARVLCYRVRLEMGEMASSEPSGPAAIPSDPREPPTPYDRVTESELEIFKQLQGTSGRKRRP
jgi:pSer/pThr/pTyr-binding forkhead associated (FHA) protein